jgi:hypothetical protein
MTVEPILPKAMRVCAFLLIVSALAAPAASGQSLADVARKESERRQAVKDGGKTYTNQDLKAVPAPSADATAPAADAAATPAAADTAADADASAAAKQADAAKPDRTAKSTESEESRDEQSKGEAYWAQRMADLRERLDRDQTFADALQNRIDALTTDFVNRDDPAQRTQIGADRQKALLELERVKKSIEQDKRAIPELEEEARRAGVPAGWLR